MEAYGPSSFPSEGEGESLPEAGGVPGEGDGAATKGREGVGRREGATTDGKDGQGESGQPEGGGVDEEGAATNHLLTNTSRLPVHLHRHFSSSPTPSSHARTSNSNSNAEPSPLSKFPSFATKVEPYAMQAILERGDLLVMPAG